jgi:hypothetical protein
VATGDLAAGGWAWPDALAVSAKCGIMVA